MLTLGYTLTSTITGSYYQGWVRMLFNSIYVEPRVMKLA